MKNKGYEDSFISAFETMLDFVPERRIKFCNLKSELERLGYNTIKLTDEEIKIRKEFLKENCRRHRITLNIS